MNFSFEGKRILVTGAGQGIGRAIALRLSKLGGKVIAISLADKNFASLSEDRNIEIIEADISDWNATRDILKSVAPVDCLVNNAGMVKLQPFLDVESRDIDTCFDINFKAVLNVSQIVTRSLINAGKPGSIVNISSQTSKVGFKDHMVYSCSKAAVDQLTRVMALELGPHNIRVNAVNPTVVMTDLGRKAWSDPEKAASMKSKIPLGRFAEIEEVVDAVVYLLSDHSSMINGVTLPIDGGFLAT